MIEHKLTWRGQSGMERVEARWPDLYPLVRTLAKQVKRGAERYQRALEEGLWVLYRVPRAWLPEGRLKAYDGDEAVGIWGLSVVGDHWGLWEIDFDEQDEVSTMIFTVDLPGDLVSGYLGAAAGTIRDCLE